MSERILTDHQKAVEEAAGMSLDWGMANAATVARSRPIHTPGPADLLWEVEGHDPDNIILRATHNGLNMGICEVFESEANARLLRAAYNAFDSAGKKLGWNAVKFAECSQDGGIADLVDALISAERFIAKQSGGGESEFRASLLAVLRKVNPGVQA